MKFIKIPTFNFEDLHGKTLKIYASKTQDGTTAIGVDEVTGVMYVLHQETNIEKPIIYNMEPPKPPPGPEPRLKRWWY